MTGAVQWPIDALAAGLAATVVVAAGLEGLYVCLGYREHLDGRESRPQMVAYGLLCGVATAAGLRIGLWLPLATLLVALAVGLHGELSPPPEFVPLGHLEPHVPTDDDRYVVENGLVLADLLAAWLPWGVLAMLGGVVELALRSALGVPPDALPRPPLTPRVAAVAAWTLGSAYPSWLVARRAVRSSSTTLPGLRAVAFPAFAWGGVWLLLAVGVYLAVARALIAPLALPVAGLWLLHLPPDEGDGPVEIVLLYWPLVVPVVAVATAAESVLH